MSQPTASAKEVVALGGGHGLVATLRALRRLPVGITAIVGTGDDGGSSGRLRETLGVPPPGDLRMALVALIDDATSGDLWPRVMQHRFGGSGDVEGHALGNLLLAALWEETGDVVAGLDTLGRALGVQGRVLPNCVEPVHMMADIVTPTGEAAAIRGQARITATRGVVMSLRVEPQDPPACPAAVSAIQRADGIILGPGSWYTSVLAHLLVPDIAGALAQSSAPVILVLNSSPQRGEAEDFLPCTYLETWHQLFPQQRLDVVLTDVSVARDPVMCQRLEQAALGVGARLQLSEVLGADGAHHDPDRLAAALAGILNGEPESGRHPVGPPMAG